VRLIADGLHHGRVTVANDGYAVAAHAIDIYLAGVVPDASSLTSHDGHVSLGIASAGVLLFEFHGRHATYSLFERGPITVPRPSMACVTGDAIRASPKTTRPTPSLRASIAPSTLMRILPSAWVIISSTCAGSM